MTIKSRIDRLEAQAKEQGYCRVCGGQGDPIGRCRECGREGREAITIDYHDGREPAVVMAPRGTRAMIDKIYGPDSPFNDQLPPVRWRG